MAFPFLFLCWGEVQVLDNKLNAQAILNGLGQGVLIFDSADKLVLDNLAARTLLGTDLKVIREEGWAAISVLFNTRVTNPDETIDEVRKRALTSPRPLRFHTYRGGEYIPCWISAVQGDDGTVYTMITIDVPDWAALNELMGRFRDEVKDAVQSTTGHLDIINASLKQMKPGETLEHLVKRISGFHRLISVHMHRTGRLITMLERLEAIRTGKLRSDAREQRRKLTLRDFVEDFLETLDEITLIDPETEAEDYRSRIQATIPADLVIMAVPSTLAQILRDVLRNAIMYSMKATPIKVVAKAASQPQTVQIDVVDEGYGIRAREAERVFAPFQRARQPQIVAEFGYGLSLYLCKQEVEAMSGRMWYESEEGVGTTFSFLLPAWREENTAKTQEAHTVAATGTAEIAASSSSSTTVSP